MATDPLREHASKHIHGKLLAGELPAGHVLSEHSLAREIGISRTPVREAIRRLEQEGILEQVPRFGTSSAVRKAPRPVVDAALMRRLLSADLGFHMVLLRASGNRRLMKIIADSRVLTRIFGPPRLEHDLAVIEETHRFHSQILKAVKQGDGEGARALMAEHIRASMREALDHYDRAHSHPDTRTIPLGLPGDLLADLDRIERGTPPPVTRPSRKRSA